MQTTDELGSILYVNNAGVYGNQSQDYVTLTNTQINSSCPILLAYKVQGLSFPPSVLGITGMGYSNKDNFLDVAYRSGQIATNTFTL